MCNSLFLNERWAFCFDGLMSCSGQVSSFCAAMWASSEEHLRDLRECADERGIGMTHQKNSGLLVAAHLKNT